jgi:hypothetical protein
VFEVEFISVVEDIGELVSDREHMVEMTYDEGRHETHERDTNSRYSPMACYKPFREDDNEISET